MLDNMKLVFSSDILESVPVNFNVKVKPIEQERGRNGHRKRIASLIGKTIRKKEIGEWIY